MNKLLQRQIERFLVGRVEETPRELAPLLRAIDEAYEGFDADRRLIERSLDISSEELSEINRRLRREISERRQMEAALRESEERFRQVAENAGEWIWEVNADGQYTYCNPTIEKMLGYTVAEVVGRMHFYDFFVGSDRERLRTAAREIFASKRSFSGFINTRIRKDGRMIVLETNGSPVIDEQGNLRGYRGADRDITERQACEVRQTLLLAQLEAANKELSDFAHVVSHDLKAPLRGIRSLADWISADCRDKLSGEAQEQLRLMQNRVDRMQNLIDGILQYSRATHVQGERVRIDLRELVAEVIDTLAPPAHIEIAIQDELPVIELERIRIFQVFQNLLSNAIKYMDKPQGRINVGCVAEDGCWKFSVSDNGPGIAEKHFDRIFQLFQTLAARDDRESTGIGLTLVKKIVEMYGGRVWVQSTLGQGSTFFFTLPRTQGEPDDERRPTRTAG